MELLSNIKLVANNILTFSTMSIILGAIVLTIKTRFVQFRGIKQMFSILVTSMTAKSDDTGKETIQAHKALFTAMSTTIGLATIAAPIITIQVGGPGALLFFLLSNILGSALSFSEVTFALKHRKVMKDGTIMGGPMQYLKDTFSEFVASWYAVFAFILLLVWSALQSNVLANLLADYNMPFTTMRYPEWFSGIILAIVVTVSLMGGIKRIGNLSEKMVPFMFFLYSAACLYIIFANIQSVPAAFDTIFRSAFTPKSIIGGSAAGGMFHAFRWGILKGMNAHEAGIGTGTIPHSMADTTDPTIQGLLSMVSIYSHGFLSLLSGLVVMVTGTWQDPSLGLGMSAISKSFDMYFSSLGPLILTISSLLFGFGTILGNSYNGSQCYAYMTKNKNLNFYNAAIAALVFIGSVAPVKFMWIITDFFLILVALPNIVGILILSFKEKSLLKIK